MKTETQFHINGMGKHPRLNIEIFAEGQVYITRLVIGRMDYGDIVDYIDCVKIWAINKNGKKVKITNKNFIYDIIDEVEYRLGNVAIENEPERSDVSCNV